MTSVSSFPVLSFYVGVILLQLGFVIREVGAVRISDTKRIIIRHFVNLLISGVVNCSLGYVLAFSDGGVADKFIGTNIYYPDTFWGYVIGIQWIIASITSSIVAGAVAERCRLIAYFIYTVFITGFIHPVVRHWTLNKRGWLDDANNSYQDLAGSGSVHVMGGMAALMGAMMIGPRTSRFDPSLKKDFNDKCHSVPVAVLGGIFLLIGFFGFIWGCRELFGVSYYGSSIEVFFTNPLVSSFIAAFTSLLINRYFGKQWNLLVAINGALTGMVAISAGSDHFEPYAAATIGLIAAIVYRAYSVLLVRFGIDDPLDVVSVHFGGGSWGLIAVAFFHRSKGLLHAWNSQSALILGWQMIGMIAIAVWTAVLSGIMFGVLRFFGILRVRDEVCDEVQKEGQVAGNRFANPVYELEDIETEDLETVDITEDASPEKICQKHTNMVSNNVGDVHL